MQRSKSKQVSWDIETMWDQKEQDQDQDYVHDNEEVSTQD